METMILITKGNIEAYRRELLRRERGPGTIDQYLRTLRRLLEDFPDGVPLQTEGLLSWKRQMAARYSVRTVNTMIAAVNGFLDFMQAPWLKLKSMKCQQAVFSEEELTEEDYRSLLDQARTERDPQLILLLQVLSGTGIRVSELPFLTAEAARRRMAVVRLKGKTRQVPLGETLCRQLLDYAKAQHISTGPIILGKNGHPLDRRRVWEALKRLCAGAGVDPKKVYPHAFRHLFARMFYGMTRDIAKLADLLGHSSINTTRIYISTTCQEHRAILDRLAQHLSTKKPPHQGGQARQRT